MHSSPLIATDLGPSLWDGNTVEKVAGGQSSAWLAPRQTDAGLAK